MRGKSQTTTHTKAYISTISHISPHFHVGAQTYTKHANAPHIHTNFTTFPHISPRLHVGIHMCKYLHITHKFHHISAHLSRLAHTWMRRRRCVRRCDLGSAAMSCEKWCTSLSMAAAFTRAASASVCVFMCVCVCVHVCATALFPRHDRERERHTHTHTHTPCSCAVSRRSANVGGWSGYDTGTVTSPDNTLPLRSNANENTRAVVCVCVCVCVCASLSLSLSCPSPRGRRHAPVCARAHAVKRERGGTAKALCA